MTPKRGARARVPGESINVEQHDGTIEQGGRESERERKKGEVRGA